MVSMLHALASESTKRTVWLVHGARDSAHHSMAVEVRRLVAAREGAHAHVAYSRPRPTDTPGIDFDSEGRVNGELLSKLIPDLDAEFYLCGPTGFLAELHADLIGRGVPADQIHVETFG